jgi:hypothetical protein
LALSPGLLYIAGNTAVQMNTKDFYVQLGKVVYAVAMADGEIQAEEKEVVIKMVKEELASIEDKTDGFGTDLAYYTLFSFEREEERENDPADAVASFFSYIERHHLHINDRTKEASIKLLRRVASSYGRTTTKEKQLLDNFERRLKAH